MKLLAAATVDQASNASGTVRVVLRVLKRRPDGVRWIWATHVEVVTLAGPTRTDGRYFGSAETAWTDYRTRCKRLGLPTREDSA